MRRAPSASVDTVLSFITWIFNICANSVLENGDKDIYILFSLKKKQHQKVLNSHILQHLWLLITPDQCSANYASKDTCDPCTAQYSRSYALVHVYELMIFYKVMKVAIGLNLALKYQQNANKQNILFVSLTCLSNIWIDYFYRKYVSWTWTYICLNWNMIKLNKFRENVFVLISTLFDAHIYILAFMWITEIY